MSTRITVAAATGLGLLATFFKLFPGCIASPYAAVDPLVTSVWLDHVAETMSFQTVLQLEPQKILGFYGFPVLTLLLAVTAMVRTAPRFQFRWIVAVVMLAALVGISIWQMRGAAAAAIIAARSCRRVWLCCGPLASRDENCCSQPSLPRRRALLRAVWPPGL